jgi:hypothetical protein
MALNVGHFHLVKVYRILLGRTLFDYWKSKQSSKIFKAS